jgi:hypothetical protein
LFIILNREEPYNIIYCYIAAGNKPVAINLLAYYSRGENKKATIGVSEDGQQIINDRYWSILIESRE